MNYAKEDVLNAARKAYFGAVGLGHDDYVVMKSQTFVERCLRFDGDLDADHISQQALDEICFAALDEQSEKDFRAVLAGSTW